jgi:hypothetical protein
MTIRQLRHTIRIVSEVNKEQNAAMRARMRR